MQNSVLVCECVRSALIGQPKLQAICAGLEAAQIPYTRVPDLCGLAARHDPLLASVAANSPPRIIACYARAVRALFQLAGAPLPEGAQLVNLREATVESALAAIGLAGTAAVPVVEKAPATPSEGGWIPWFPVIDVARCTQCQQCLGFCLFGVYALVDGKVVVQNPEGCKTNCPACARICPQVAIIFPKYESGAIAGAEITDEEKEKSRVQVDLQTILGSDVYQGLAERRRKVQQRKLLRPDLEQAHQERQEHLARSGLSGLPELPGAKDILSPPT